MGELPRGTVTFLFTDIEGSTALWEQDRGAMRAAVDRQLAILHNLIGAHHGVLYKTVGDGTQAAFASAEEALRAAVASQRALLAEAWADPSGPLRVRMALHAGEATPDAHGDYLSAPLNRLSRLLSTGHGGQILLSQTVQQLTRGALPAGTTLQDLGEHRLRDLLEPEHVFQLVHPDLSGDFPPLRSLDARPHNLPRQPTPFLGREHQMAEVVDLLRRDDTQLLTLVGPGGTGKTRLALQAAAEVLDDFADGVCFVPLAAIADPAFIPSAIATALGLREEGEQSLANRVHDFLATRDLLLVLDNFEHLVDGGPDIWILMGSAPRLKVLATSRVPLRLRAEREYPVPPLSLPRRKPPPTAEQLSQFEAVHLFIDRAQAVKPDFAVDNENAPAVAEICWRLDGLPLAIELAAARVRMLPPQTILARLEQRLPFLTSGARDAPERQRTLRDTIAWSYDLLEPDEQILFRRLAVFAGGCTLEAAEAVGNHDGALDVFGSVERLVEHNLLRQQEGPASEPRFSMLETVREYGLERLTASGEGEDTRHRHTVYFTTLAGRAGQDLLSRRQRDWVERLEADHDNLRAALSWADQSGEAELLLRLAGEVAPFWHMRGHFREGGAWLERALAAGGQPSTSLVRALLGAGSLAVARRELTAAGALTEQSLALARRLGDQLGIARALAQVGVIAMFKGDYDRARAVLGESLTVARAVGEESDIARSLIMLGELERFEGDDDRAITLNNEGLATARSSGAQYLVAICLSNLASLARARGDLGEAATLYGEALTEQLRIGTPQHVAQGLAALAGIIGDWGRSDRAARLLGAAAAGCEALGVEFQPLERAQAERDVLAARTTLGTDAFGAAWEAGRELPLEEAVAEARAVIDELGHDSEAIPMPPAVAKQP